MTKCAGCKSGVSALTVALAVLVAGAGFPGGQSAQADERSVQWTWVGGASTGGALGVYGTLGAAAAGNMPGARSSACSWVDSAGNAWVFGGYGCGADNIFGSYGLNDLWKRDAVTGLWTWMKGSQNAKQSGSYGSQGVPAAANTPGARQSAVSWTDAAGMLWLFGGYGYDSAGSESLLNDLWKYNPATGNWTWMKGASTGGPSGTYGTQGVPAAANTPGARQSAVTWTDASGALWLFGGVGSGMARHNDLWKYTPSTGNWTWMKGATTNSPNGTYGTLGTPAPENTPCGRYGAVSWVDASGALWLFGGFGEARMLNDLWKYDPSTGNWVWMKGSSSGNAGGVYGTMGTPAAENTPGGRYLATSWTDASGALWLFGGEGLDAEGVDGQLSDVWKYTPSTGNWTWMKGASTDRQPAAHGVCGTTAPTNTPGARESVTTWIDASGVAWLLGGSAYHNGWALSEINDLWRMDLFDTVPPTGTVTINGNRSTTNSRTVTVAMTWSDGTDGSGVARMRFSDDGSTWSAYESLTPSKSYTLPVGDDGYRTIRVQFIDKANNRSATCSDYIRLDRSAPTGGVVINNGATTTTTRSVTLKLNWADTGSGVVRMRFSDNGSTWTNWMYPVATKAYTLPAGLGYHTVRVQYLDGANNYSPVYNDYIKLVAP